MTPRRIRARSSAIAGNDASRRRRRAARCASASSARRRHRRASACRTRDSASSMPRLASSRRSCQISRDVVAERVAADDLRIARMRQVDRRRLRFSRPGRYVIDEHAVGELHGLGQVVRDEQRGLLQRLLDLQHLVAEQQARLLVQRGERLVHQQDARLGGERARDGHALPHAAGQLGGIAALEAREADERDEMRGALHPLRLGDACDLERKRDVLARRCATETSTPPGTPCRSRDACRRSSSPSTVTLPS